MAARSLALRFSNLPRAVVLVILALGIGCTDEPLTDVPSTAEPIVGSSASLASAPAGTVDRVTLTPTDTLRIGPVGDTATLLARAWVGNTEVATPIKWWIRQKHIASISSTKCTSPCSMTVKGLALGSAFLDARDFNGGDSPPRDNVIIKVTSTAPPTDSTKPPTDTTTPPPPPPPPPPVTAFGNCGAAVCAFPGAVGFGSQTKAGRGGALLRVTNLNDTGAGSLRAALQASGPRTIVFEVSGTIRLASNLTVTNPFVTVAGQTAPSPGITLRGAGLIISTNDVLIQHIRIRTGDDPSGPSTGSRDATRLHGGAGVFNVVLDHVSASWGVDENCGTSTSGTRRDLTISHSIISEGLAYAGHPDGEHSKGCLFGQGTQRIALIGTVMAHNRDRNPWFKGGTSGVVVNNVIYNWGTGSSNACYIGLGSTDLFSPNSQAIVGNSFLRGVNSSTSNRPIKVSNSVVSGTRVHVADNRLQRNAPPADPWLLATNEEGSSIVASSPPVWPTGLTAIGSGTVESTVLGFAGARPADRDAVDARIVKEVQTLTGRIIDSPSQVGGWPALAQNTRPFVTPANPSGDDDGDGYTNLEEVLHQMAATVEGR